MESAGYMDVHQQGEARRGPSQNNANEQSTNIVSIVVSIIVSKRLELEIQVRPNFPNSEFETDIIQNTHTWKHKHIHIRTMEVPPMTLPVMRLFNFRRVAQSHHSGKIRHSLSWV